MLRVQADFNGLFQGWTILCLSHSDHCLDENGDSVQLSPGMSMEIPMISLPQVSWNLRRIG